MGGGDVMMEKFLILLVIFLPGFCAMALAASSLIFSLKERVISVVSQTTLWLTFLLSLFIALYWILFQRVPMAIEVGDVYRTHAYSFPLTFLVDHYSLIYLFLTTILANLTAKYSRYYLHREEGYLRYFTMILLMVSGSNLVAFAGTLDLLFAGWELIGFSSFFLIGFYWHRHQPARNAFVAFTVYRLCDIGLLAATMLGHVLKKDGQGFVSLSHMGHLLGALPVAHFDGILMSIAALLVFASLGKSAQFPFMNWLPRAMEGPTPSSAIFYGALSIHAGIFLLIRTESLWGLYPSVKVLLALIGFLSVICATLTGRTLSNIKGQLAYASITQVGIMFIELALGLKLLATVHFVLHAFLRTYQILISPSIIAHALRLIGNSLPLAKPFVSSFSKVQNIFSENFKLAVYRLSLSDFFMWPSRTALSGPFPGFRLSPIPLGLKAYTLVSVYILESVFFYRNFLTAHPLTSMVICILMVITSVEAQKSERAFTVWFKVGQVLVFGFLGAFLLDPVNSWSAVSAYYLAAFSAWLLGSLALQKLGNLSLKLHHGRIQDSPFAAYLFLACLLVIAGIPPSPTFIAEDLLLHWGFEQGIFWTVSLTLTLTLITISTARIYTKLCLGPKSPTV